MIERAPGPSEFVVRILNSQPNLLLPEHSQAVVFFVPLSLAYVDPIDDQPLGALPVTIKEL